MTLILLVCILNTLYKCIYSSFSFIHITFGSSHMGLHDTTINHTYLEPYLYKVWREKNILIIYIHNVSM